jgi:hypothetical protein
MSLEDALNADKISDAFSTLDERSAAALTVNVERVRSFVAGLPGERDAWVLLHEEPHVKAVLTMRGYPTSADGRSELVEDLHAPALAGDIDVINRTVREIDLPAGLAVETHDFSIAHDFETGTRPASERATVTIFAPGGVWAVDFMLVTQDLILFEDSLEYLHGIAETVLPFAEVVR